MRRIPWGIAVAMLLALPLVAAAQDAQMVKGKVTAVTGNSLTVSVDGKDMTFTVDATTKVTAPGGGTAARAAQKEGAKGPDFSSLLKAGDNVEVRYHEMGGTMHAMAIRRVAATGSAASEEKTVRGTVTAITADSVTVKEAAGEVTFTIDPKTMVEGTGVGTKARAMKTAGQPTVVTEFVAVNDTVVVRYTEAEGKKVAANVRVMEKGKK